MKMKIFLYYSDRHHSMRIVVFLQKNFLNTSFLGMRNNTGISLIKENLHEKLSFIRLYMELPLEYIYNILHQREPESLSTGTPRSIFLIEFFCESSKLQGFYIMIYCISDLECFGCQYDRDWPV